MTSAPKYVYIHVMKGAPDSRTRASGLAGSVCFNFRKATRVITKIYDDALRPGGLTAAQFSILSALGLTGSLSIAKLAALLAMERTTLTRNLRLLEKKGLVRSRPGDDLRTRIVSLSAKGRRAHEGALPLWREAQASVTEKIGAEKWAAMLLELQKVVRALKAG